MDLLIGILLFLTVPVFYFVGLVAFIRWLARGRHSQPSLSQEVFGKGAAAKIRDAARGQSPDIVVALYELAGRVDGTGDAYQPPVPTGYVPAKAVAPTAHHAPSTTSKPAEPARPSFDVMHSLDNINVILYLGAFLVVVSAGIFVGYNFESLSGSFKTVFLALFAAVFYATGLVLFMRSIKLRPAGVTFTGIGLVLLPLVGVAAYNFTPLHDHGPFTWFVTSVITLAFYIVTLAVTRQTYIAYLMSFTGLSLFESTVSLINLPVYWFGWIMSLVSILLLTLSRSGLFFENSSAALRVSANVFLPISLLLSLFSTTTDGLTQLGVTIGIAAVFYAGMAKLYAKESVGGMYFGLALISFPAGLGLGLWDHLSRTAIAVVILGVCAAYWAGERMAIDKLDQHWREILGLVIGLLPFVGMVVLYDHHGAVTAILAAAVLVNAEQAVRLRQTPLSLLAIISLLGVPYALGRFYIDPALSWGWVAGLYLLATPILVWWANRTRNWPDSGRAVGTFGYLATLILALFTAATSSPGALFWVALVAAAAFYGLAWYEKVSGYVYAAAACFYLALVQPAALHQVSGAGSALLLLLAGAAFYIAGSFEPDKERALALRYSGVAGPFLGALAGLGQDPPPVEPVLALAAGGGLLWVEARRQAQTAVQEVAGGILILAFNWLCSVSSITETQVYTLPWAAYVAYLAYRRRSHGREAYEGFTIAALCVLTLPLAGQALQDGGQGYGLLLIAEALGLVFLGMALSYRLVTVWGAATLVAEVLYQLRDFFYAVPKYVISAGLGLALLAVAIVMLQRRKSGD